MSRARSGALFLALTAAFAAAPAGAQNAGAFAQAAARSAGNGAFDTLVTPEALRALRRLADSTKAAVEVKQTLPATPGSNATQAALPAARTPQPTRQARRTALPGSTPAISAERATPAAEGAGTEQGAAVISAIAIERRGDRSELRIVSTTPAKPALSEPFRTDGRTRLFLTFADASLAVASPTVDTAMTVVAGLDAAQREDDVRIAIDATRLDGYGLESSGDTTILWLTHAADVQAAQVSAEAVTPARPSDLELAGESARAGWKAFRNDVARATSATVGFGARAGRATLATVKHGGAAAARVARDASRGIGDGAAAAVAWLGANIPLGGIARALTFIALLLAPTAGVLLLMRNRRTSPREQPTGDVPAVDVPIVAPSIDIRPITRRTTSSATAPQPVLAAAPPSRAPSLARAERKAAKAIARAEAKAAKRAARAAKAAAPASPAQPGKPRVTRTTADARLWAAKTLAASGADAADIARQTGLSREAAVLLVRTARTARSGV